MTSAMMASTTLPLAVLHYATPVVFLTSQVVANIVATIFLHQQSAENRTRRFSSILFLFAAVVTFIAQAVAYFAQALIHHGFWARQDQVVYTIVSIFAFGSQLIGLLEHSTVVWYPYGISAVLATALEISISVLESLKHPHLNGFDFTRLALQVVRSLLLVVYSLLQGWFTLQERRQGIMLKDDTEPLLANGSNGVAKANYATIPENDEDFDDGSSGDIDSDMDDPDQLKEIKLQQRKRLQESGSWWNYMKEFKIFIPMLWPRRNRFVQLCLVLIGLVIVAQRFLNVMVPRQLGIITDELAKGNGDGFIPWKNIGLWALFCYLNSAAGIHVIMNLAELPVEQFTYKAIGAASFGHIMHLSMDFHNEKNSGELIRSIEQGHTLQSLLDFVFFQVGPMFVDILVAFVFVYRLFDVYMSLILAAVGFAYVWTGFKTTAWSIKRRRHFNTAWRYETRVQNEAINNWQTVSHFNRGEYECDKYGKAIDDFNKAEMSYYLAYHIGGAAQTFTMVLGRIAATFLAVYRVSQGTAPIGNLIALTFYWGNIEGPLADVSWSIRRTSQMITDSERLLQLFQTKPSVTNVPGAADINIKEGHVEFQHVEFSYDPRKPTLRDISFTAKPGQTIALCGETGGGKSTILKLLYRYYDVSSGVIRIDGQDIRGVTLDSLREAFGQVPQDPALFNISIMENVRYARLDATDEEVKEACRAAAIHDKIESFPDGYKSTVGERGVKLSGGELQRVAIARAILRRPKIVLLDEATSMIDAETEAVIQQAFKRLSQSRTTFVIAHRLSTIQHADLILVIQDGEIIERGTHEQLFQNKNGKYVALWSKQLSRAVQEVGQTLSGSSGEARLIDVEEREEPKRD